MVANHRQSKISRTRFEHARLTLREAVRVRAPTTMWDAMRTARVSLQLEDLPAHARRRLSSWVGAHRPGARSRRVVFLVRQMRRARADALRSRRTGCRPATHGDGAAIANRAYLPASRPAERRRATGRSHGAR